MKYIQSTYTAVTLAGILLNLSGMSVLLGGHHATPTLEGQTAKSAASWYVDRAARESQSPTHVPASLAPNEYDQVAVGELQ